MLGSSSLSMDDLISYGFLPEFVGRFPVEAPPLLPRRHPPLPQCRREHRTFPTR